MEMRRNEKRGWLKALLTTHNFLPPGKDALWCRIMGDYQCQIVAIEAMQSAIGEDFKDRSLRRTRFAQINVQCPSQKPYWQSDGALYCGLFVR